MTVLLSDIFILCNTITTTSIVRDMPVLDIEHITTFAVFSDMLVSSIDIGCLDSLLAISVGDIRPLHKLMHLTSCDTIASPFLVHIFILVLRDIIVLMPVDNLMPGSFVGDNLVPVKHIPECSLRDSSFMHIQLGCCDIVTALTVLHITARGMTYKPVVSDMTYITTSDMTYRLEQRDMTYMTTVPNISDMTYTIISIIVINKPGLNTFLNTWHKPGLTRNTHSLAISYSSSFLRRALTS